MCSMQFVLPNGTTQTPTREAGLVQIANSFTIRYSAFRRGLSTTWPVLASYLRTATSELPVIQEQSGQRTCTTCRPYVQVMGSAIDSRLELSKAPG